MIALLHTPGRRAVALALALVASTVTAAGCGDDESDVGVPATEAPATSTATSATPPPTVGDTTVGTVDSDPLSTSDAASNNDEGTVP